MSTLLGDLDVILDYLNKHNVPVYLDPVVARLREAEKRLREELAFFAQPVFGPDDPAVTLLERINGGPVSP